MDTQLCVCLGNVCICADWGLWVLCVYMGVVLCGGPCVQCGYTDVFTSGYFVYILKSAGVYID